MVQKIVSYKRIYFDNKDINVMELEYYFSLSEFYRWRARIEWQKLRFEIGG